MESASNNLEYVELKRSVYREYSRSYDEDRKQFVTSGSLNSRIEWALEPLGSKQRLLDLGCGSGELLQRAVMRTQGGVTAVGLDLTPEMLALAKDRVGPDVDLVECNVLDGLPLRDESFHVVTSLNLVQELPSSATAPLLAEVSRVLKPGGYFRVAIPCMSENNPASSAFRDMAIRRGGMDFPLPESLERIFENTSCFTGVETSLHPSPAMSAAAQGKTRFKFFTSILEEVRNNGLDPNDVSQSVFFFSGKRQA